MKWRLSRIMIMGYGDVYLHGMWEVVDIIRVKCYKTFNALSYKILLYDVKETI